jgi:hypothetical protein
MGVGSKYAARSRAARIEGERAKLRKPLWGSANIAVAKQNLLQQLQQDTFLINLSTYTILKRLLNRV